MAGSILNFSKDRLITGVNIIDGMLFFTDGENEPKKINIKQFKNNEEEAQYGNADHSSGTTSIYGRPFQERDITVIKPHPKGFDLSLSADEVISQATRPLVTTLQPIPSFTTAILLGESSTGLTDIVERGFYYLEDNTSTSITHADIVSNGTKKVSSNAGFQFQSQITNLTASSKHYVFAFAFNGVDERIDGDIIPFTTGGVSFTAPVVETKLAEKIAGRGFNLKGTITNTGDSTVIKKGFYYKELDILNQYEPSDLENEPQRRILLSTEPVDADGNFKAELRHLTSTGRYYYQAFAENTATGVGKGVVKTTLSTGSEGPEIQFLGARLSSENENTVVVKARVIRSNSERVATRGFYISKITDQQVIMLGQYDTNSNIHKVEVDLNAYNQFEEFEFDTVNLPGQDGILSLGEKINFMAFATNNNNNFSKTDVFPFINENNTGTEPSIVLENVAYNDSSDPGIIVRAELINSGLQTTRQVSSMGYHVIAKDPSYVFPTDQEERKKEILDAVNDKTAYTYIFKESLGGPFGFTDAVVEGVGSHTFNGSDNVPLESNMDYYFIAWANNGQSIGYSRVKSPFNASEGNAPLFATKPGRAKEGTTDTLIMEAEITSRIANSTVYDAGFRWVAKGNKISTATSFPNIGTTAAADLQNYVNNKNTGTKSWSKEVSGFLSNSTYSIQAWIQPTATSGKVFAPTETIQIGSIDGVVDLTTLSTPAQLPIPSVDVRNISAVQARFISSYTRKNITGSRAISSMSPKFYYMKKSMVTGSDDNARREYIRANTTLGLSSANADKGQIPASYDPNNINSDDFWINMGEIDDSIFTPTNFPKLAQNTEYYVFSSVNNGVSSTLSYGSFAQGEGISNLHEFKTINAPLTAPFPINEKTGRILTSGKVNISATVAGTNSNYNWTGTYPLGFFYIKSSELTVNTPQGVKDQGTFVPALNRSRQFYANIELEKNTAYKWIAIVSNSEGSGISSEIQVITNGENAAYSGPASIRPKENSVNFNSAGGRDNIRGAEDMIIEHSGIEVFVTPALAGFTAKAGKWSTGATGPSFSIEDGRDGSVSIVLFVGVNLGRERACYITLTHGTDSTKTATIYIKQAGAGYSGSGGSGGRGIGDGDGENILVKNDHLLIT